MRVLVSLTAFALIAGLTTSAGIAKNPVMNGKHTMVTARLCKAPSVWVAPVRRKNGKLVKGHCVRRGRAAQDTWTSN